MTILGLLPRNGCSSSRSLSGRISRFRATTTRTGRAFAAATTTTTSSSSSSSSSSSTPHQYNLVRWEVHPIPNNPSKAIGCITLQSPDTFNALTVEMGREFSALCRHLHDTTLHNVPPPHHHHDAVNQFDDPVEIAAIVLTGQGDRAFSAGGNLQWLRLLGDHSVHANTVAMLHFYKSFLCLRQLLPVPVIGALPGPAVGAGAGLALACDLRIAQQHSPNLLGLNFTRLGIHSGMGGSHFLAQALGGGSTVLNEILLLGKILSARECLELKLVNQLSENPKQAAFDMGHEIAQRHPVAVRTMLQTLRQKQDEGLEQALQREAYAQAVCYARGDWPEGVNAVAEKRDPVFQPYHSK